MHIITPEQAILRALCTTYVNTTCSHSCDYALENCPTFWLKVFIYYYGEKPRGTKDEIEPRWNELFKEGYAILRTHALLHHNLKTAS